MYSNTWQLLLYLGGNANLEKIMDKIQIWKIYFFIYQWVIRRPGKFCASFLYANIKTAFCFLHIWSNASSQLWSMTLLWCGRNKISPNHWNNVLYGLSSHSLVLDRLAGSIISSESTFFPVFNQKKLRVQIQHQNGSLENIYGT